MGKKKKGNYLTGFVPVLFIGFFTYSAFYMRENPQILPAGLVCSNKKSPPESENEHLTVTATTLKVPIPHTECNH